MNNMQRAPLSYNPAMEQVSTVAPKESAGELTAEQMRLQEIDAAAVVLDAVRRRIGGEVYEV